jgi:hypothetical protein
MGAATEERSSGREVRRAALRFFDAFVLPSTARPREVPRALRSATTPALWEGLRLTRPDALPRGSVDLVDVEEAGAFSGRVSAELDSGDAYSVTVVAWERGWRVSDVRPEDPA